MIESLDSLKQLGLKAVPSVVFIGTFTWFNAQMDNRFNLLSDRIDYNQRIIESKIEANEKINSMRFDMLNNKIDGLSSRVGRVESQLNSMRGKHD